LEDAIAEHNRELESCKNIIAKLEKDKASLTRDIQDNEAKLLDTGKRIDVLQRENNNLRNEISEWEGKVDKSSESATKLSKKQLRN